AVGAPPQSVSTSGADQVAADRRGAFATIRNHPAQLSSRETAWTTCAHVTGSTSSPPNERGSKRLTSCVDFSASTTSAANSPDDSAAPRWAVISDAMEATRPRSASLSIASLTIVFRTPRRMHISMIRGAHYPPFHSSTMRELEAHGRRVPAQYHINREDE